MQIICTIYVYDNKDIYIYIICGDGCLGMSWLPCSVYFVLFPAVQVACNHGIHDLLDNILMFIKHGTYSHTFRHLK